MAVLVQLIVGEFELVEGDHLLHPLGSFRGGVGVDMDARGGVGVGLSSHDPAGSVECISGNVSGRLNVDCVKPSIH